MENLVINNTEIKTQNTVIFSKNQRRISPFRTYRKSAISNMTDNTPIMNSHMSKYVSSLR